MKYLVLISFIISITCFADDPYLASKGTILPQDSWVFSPTKALEIRNKLIDLDTNVKLNESLQKSLTLEQLNGKIQQDKINLVMEQNDKLAKSLYAERSVSDGTKLVWFLIGVSATILTTYGVSQINR